MEGVREGVEVIGRVVRLVIKVVKVLVVVVEELGELMRVGGRVGRVIWEMVGEGRGILVMIGNWVWRIGGWVRERVESWMEEY